MWRASLEEQYEERIAALRRAGEPVTLEELTDPERVAAYQPVRDAIEWYQAYLEERGPEPGDELGRDESEWTEADWRLAARYYEGCRPFVDRVEMASHGGPFEFRVDWRDLESNDLVRVRLLIEGLRYWIGIHLRHEDGGPEVVRATASLLRIANRLEVNWIMSLMLRETMRAVAHRQLCEATQRDFFDLGQAMESLRPLLREERPPSELGRALRALRVTNIWCFERFLRDGDAEAYLRMAAPWADDIGRKVLVELLELHATQGIAYKAFLRYLDYMEQAISIADRPPLEAMSLLVDHAERNQGSGPVALLTDHHRLIPPRFYSHRLHALAFQRLCRVELALHLFRRTYGRWPQSLEELPGPVPLNPYRETPFRYENGVLWAEPPEERFFDEGDTRDPLRVELTDQR
jgi:hypothetical protein